MTDRIAEIEVRPSMAYKEAQEAISEIPSPNFGKTNNYRAGGGA